MKKKILVCLLLFAALIGITAQAEWYDVELQSCKNKGFVSAELFENPDAYITRGEVCELLVSYYVHKSPSVSISEKDNSFNDIASSKNKDAIEKAYSLGIINGMTNTEFAPDENITREQFVSLIYRMNGSPLAETFIYEDINEISEYALPAIDYSVANKIVMGTQKGYFSPKDNITRAQAIVIVNRLDDNKNIEIGDKAYSSYTATGETINYVSYIMRKFDPMRFRMMISGAIEKFEIEPDVLVILDKNTGTRKTVTFEKIVSLRFFDVGDTLYVPICKITAQGVTDSRTEGMYIVDKKTGVVKEIETPELRDLFAFADGCIYYRTYVKTGERSSTPTLSKYNIETGEITMSSQGCLYDFTGSYIMYLDDKEMICCRNSNEEESVYSVDMDTLEMTVVFKRDIATANADYFVSYSDEGLPFVALYSRKNGEFIKNINMCDETGILLGDFPSDINQISMHQMCDYLFYDVNGEIFIRHKNALYATCITNSNMFKLDFFYDFFNDGYMEDSVYMRKNRSFFLGNPESTSFGGYTLARDRVLEDAAVASLYSRKVFDISPDLQFLTDAKREVQKFCIDFKSKYKDPHELVRALNNYLTFECNYDYATYQGLPTDRKYSAYSAEGLIVEKSGVCDSYARAVEKVLSYAGIKCKYVTGHVTTAPESHAWNVVELDGKKYWIDCTWNSGSKDPDEYYLLSFEKMAEDHILDKQFMHLVQ